VAKIDKDTSLYFVEEEPYDEKYVFEMEDSQWYYYNDSDEYSKPVWNSVCNKNAKGGEV